MSQVMLALVPGTLLYAALISLEVLTNLLILVLSALVFEACLLTLRRRSVLSAWRDGSIILAAWLLALCLPPTLPAWQLIVGSLIMCTLGKHVFGGLGHNPFNPAMVAYALLLVSFPATMTEWQSSAHTHTSIQQSEWDSVTGATPLDQIRYIKRSPSLQAKPDTQTQMTARVLSSPWVWINACWLFGGLYLLVRRIISWHIPVAILATLATLYLLSGIGTNAATLPVIPALFSGAIMLGAFFIATDPVSAASSHRGKLVYGFGIGLLCFIVREYSIYPEGFAFAVLLMNSCVPLIDRLFTRA